MSDRTLESKHADLLNKLNDMQRSLNYAARRPVLVEAESLIVSQERRIAELTAINADLLEACKAIFGPACEMVAMLEECMSAPTPSESLGGRLKLAAESVGVAIAKAEGGAR